MFAGDSSLASLSLPALPGGAAAAGMLDGCALAAGAGEGDEEEEEEAAATEEGGSSPASPSPPAGTLSAPAPAGAALAVEEEDEETETIEEEEAEAEGSAPAAEEEAEEEEAAPAAEEGAEEEGAAAAPQASASVSVSDEDADPWAVVVVSGAPDGAVLEVVHDVNVADAWTRYFFAAFPDGAARDNADGTSTASAPVAGDGEVVLPGVVRSLVVSARVVSADGDVLAEAAGPAAVSSLGTLASSPALAALPARAKLASAPRRIKSGGGSVVFDSHDPGEDAAQAFSDSTGNSYYADEAVAIFRTDGAGADLERVWCADSMRMAPGLVSWEAGKYGIDDALGAKVYEECAASAIDPWQEDRIATVQDVRRALDYLMAHAGTSDIPSYATSYRVQYAVWCFTNPTHVWIKDGWQVVYGDRDAGTLQGLDGALVDAGANADIVALVSAAQAYADSDSHAYDGWSRYYTMDTSGSNGYSSALLTYSQSIVARACGTVSLDKSSADPSMTSGNASYSLEGAVYGVYIDEACTQLVTTMATDASGHASCTVGCASEAAPYSSATRYVKEISAPRGYALDGTAYRVTVRAGADAAVAFSGAASHAEAPQNDPTSVVAYKVDGDTGEASAQGGASLAGAEVTLRYYAGQYALSALPAAPDRTWVLRTDEDGEVHLSDSYKVSGDDFYTGSLGSPTIPLGTVTYQETKAPEGYRLNSEVFIRNFVGDTGGGTEPVALPQVPTIPDTPQHGGISVQKTVSAPGLPDGGSLAGIVFQVVNAGDNPVTVSGTSYARGEVVCTLTTDSQGRASTASDLLPYGTYTVRESFVPASARLAKSAPDQTVEVHGDGALVSLTFEDAPQTTVPNWYTVRVKKVDEDGNPLAGATFGLFAATNSRGAAYAENPDYTAVSGADGVAEFTGVGFTADGYSYYLVRETAAPQGYSLEGGGFDLGGGRLSSGFAVDLRASGFIADLTSYPCVDKEGTGGVRALKTDPAGNGLAGAVFEVRDSSGAAVATMASGAGGVAEASGLPMGSYTVVEKEAPEGYALNSSWSASFTLSSDGQVADLTSDPCVDDWPEEPVLPAAGGDARGREAAGLAGGLAAAAGLALALARRLRTA